MKKQFPLLSFLFLLVIAIGITAYTPQQGKEKEKKQQPQDKGNSKGNQGKNDKPNPQDKNKDKDQKNNQGNQGNNDNRNNDNKDNRDNGNNNNQDSRGEGNAKNKNKDHDYDWNPDNFKDRKKIKNQDKVTICHKFNRNNGEGVTIRVSSNALKAHLNHGDIQGDCPAVKDNRYSDGYLKNRTDYYNTLQNSQEQVYYSQSILDYAVQRLTGSRQQLLSMQNNNMPLADIQRKQATVVELEENVSLLESLLTVAANLVASKFQ